MPINPSPEYKQAEAEFRKAREPQDRLHWLREMLRTIPKHKGTEHLQSDLKVRIKELTDELAGPKKGGARTGPAQTVRAEGAAQVALIGPPNAGKSSLHARLTGSHAEVGPYPFTTKAPLPGMLAYRDVHFQLVDLPPVSADYLEPWLPNALQPADAALLIIDLSDPECVEQLATIRQRLLAKKITLSERWPFAWSAQLCTGPLVDARHDPLESAAAAAPSAGPEPEETLDPFHVVLPTLLLANKCDVDSDPGEAAALLELLDVRYPTLATSAVTGAGLDAIGPCLFQGLGVVRVYTKAPGRPPDSDRPYTLRCGATVAAVARLVHRELAETLKFARIWGSGQFDGQQVGKEHVLRDGDVVELHT